MSQLENDRQSYINYIETVSAICGMNTVLNDMEQIRTLPLQELNELSVIVEGVYNVYLENGGGIK